MREVPDGVEQHALISPSKVSLETFGQIRRIAVVRCPLDHESRGLPLDACELDRTCLNLSRSTVYTQEPLVPEASCLIKRWNRKEAFRLICEGQSGDGRDPFWKQCCDCRRLWLPNHDRRSRSGRARAGPPRAEAL